MKLKRGISLRNNYVGTDSGVSINSGVVHYSESPTETINFDGLSFIPSYEDDAHVPKRDWRDLSDSEIKLLNPIHRSSGSNTIYLGNIPKRLESLFRKLNLVECQDREQVFAKFKENPDVTDEINVSMQNFLSSKSKGLPFHFHYLGTNLPNLEVVACDTTVMPPGYSEWEKRYMGIHNDGTQYVSTYSLHRLGNRLTINLGRSSRSFVFVNLTLTQALNMLREKIDIKEHKIDIVNISHYFFKIFPDYPVIKVRQKPYQFYIAPTDNCFHDGSTLGSDDLDIIMVYFGSFKA